MLFTDIDCARFVLLVLTESCSTHKFHLVPCILAYEQVQGCDGERQWYLLVVSTANLCLETSAFQRVKTEIGKGQV